MFILLLIMTTLCSCLYPSKGSSPTSTGLDLSALSDEYNFRSLVSQFTTPSGARYSTDTGNVSFPLEMEEFEFADAKLKTEQDNGITEELKAASISFINKKIKTSLDTYMMEQVKFQLTNQTLSITQVGGEKTTGLASILDASGLNVDIGEGAPIELASSHSFILSQHNKTKFVLAMDIKLKNGVVYNPMAPLGISLLTEKPVGIPTIYVDKISGGMFLIESQSLESTTDWLDPAKIATLESNIIADFGQGKTFNKTSGTNVEALYLDGHINSFNNSLSTLNNLCEDTFATLLDTTVLSVPANGDMPKHLAFTIGHHLRRAGRVFLADIPLNIGNGNIDLIFQFLRTETNNKAIYGVNVICSPQNYRDENGDLVNDGYKVLTESNGDISVNNYDPTGNSIAIEIANITHSFTFTEQ